MSACCDRCGPRPRGQGTPPRRDPPEPLADERLLRLLANSVLLVQPLAPDHQGPVLGLGHPRWLRLSGRLTRMQADVATVHQGLPASKFVFGIDITAAPDPP